jgi:hypothetical protein
VVRALAAVSGCRAPPLAIALIGRWQPLPGLARGGRRRGRSLATIPVLPGLARGSGARTELGSFGPVHQGVPEQVFELAFEGISRSTRHKSGIALRFPGIAR